MRPFVLIGAGFSRNWGGWLASEAFEYLLGCPEIAKSPHLKALLWKHQPAGGFEDALSLVQDDYRRDPAGHSAELKAMQDIVSRMFADMNQGFSQQADWEFQQDQRQMVRTFLIRFEAIFSLNQDLLLEQKYLNDNVSLGSVGKWSACHIPGMKPLPNQDWKYGDTTATGIWVPDSAMTLQPNLQPLLKLHGSSNWRHPAGSSLLIMGGNKAHAIRTHPILNAYMEQFERCLAEPDARLMVVGYGFRDPHINAAISNAVDRGLKFFVIDPQGSGLAQSLNPTRSLGHITARTSLEEIFETGLIGASRRSLREIFGSDIVEHRKVMRFFDA